MARASTNNVAERIRSFILEKFPLSRKPDFGNEDSLVAKGILDSMGVLDVVEFIEHEFQIAIADDDLQTENFETINRLTLLVIGKKPELRKEE